MIGLSGLEVEAFNLLSNFADLKNFKIEKNHGDACLNPSTQEVEARKAFEVQGCLKNIANRPFSKPQKEKDVSRQ